MANTLNEAFGNLHAALIRIRDRGGAARERLAALQQALAEGRVPPPALFSELKEIATHLDDLEETLRPFKL